MVIMPGGLLATAAPWVEAARNWAPHSLCRTVPFAWEGQSRREHPRLPKAGAGGHGGARKLAPWSPTQFYS